MNLIIGALALHGAFGDRLSSHVAANATSPVWGRTAGKRAPPVCFAIACGRRRGAREAVANWPCTTWR